MTVEPGGHRDFFESRYRSAQRDADTIPWASLAPSRFVVDQAKAIAAHGRDAVVVGCGLGDDAEHLASLGWTVTAFDVSPSAIAWCRERFEQSTVDYVVADLFAPDPEWLGRFSLVVEVATIQSLAPEHRRRTIAAIAALVAPGGTLLVSAIGRRMGDHGSGPPWPVKRDELRWFESLGLDEVSFESRPSAWEGFDRLNVEYERRT
jgi:2-polyprenyl-3-methyl-5-hydroxy-6-metoxy-1,4-benzoquinol methylase